MHTQLIEKGLICAFTIHGERLIIMKRRLTSVAYGRSFIGSLLLLVTISGCSGQNKLNFSPNATTPASAESAPVQNSYADVVSRVSPAVVTVRSVQRNRPSQQYPFMDDPFFRDFFGDRMPQQQPPRRAEI